MKKTTELQKNYGIAFFSLGNVHADLKEYYEAISCYQKAIEINPRIVGAYNNLGLIMYEKGNIIEGINSC